MTCEKYEDHRFQAKTRKLIDQAVAILAEYDVRVTVRQLFYQFVARALIANAQTSYKRIAETVRNARMAGMISWDAIEDRGRWLRELPSWESPADAIEAIATHYREPIWSSQPIHVEVWIEKDALLGVIGDVCDRYRVPYFSCRGYSSISALREAGRRLWRADKPVCVLVMGDHDPSGMDMTRNIRERIEQFSGLGQGRLRMDRIALTREQVDDYGLPPQPAKRTDTRARGYIAEHGGESWELDALPPDVLAALVETRIVELIDADAWDAAIRAEKTNQGQLLAMAKKQ